MPNEADVVWRFDMMKELGRHAEQYERLLGDGRRRSAAGQHVERRRRAAQKRVPSPKAPSFIALDKRTGKLIWADNSPGGNILDGQWSSPAAAVLGGVPQAIFAGGDGWVYSFRAAPGVGGKPELLWKFDANPKKSVWKTDGSGDRNNIVATPVMYDGRVYIATGAEPDYGEGPGCLWCIDPTKRGDVSPELVVDKQGKPISDAVRASRRICAIDESAGETLRPNPNSAAVWRYAGFDANGDGKLDFEETMHRSISMAVIKDGLLVIADLSGLVHCLDAKTGKVHWTHDLMSQVWGSPCVADGKIYIGDQDGDVAVFELSSKPKLLAKNAMGDAVYSTPVVADDVLYISTITHLIAVGQVRSRWDRLGSSYGTPEHSYKSIRRQYNCRSNASRRPNRDLAVLRLFRAALRLVASFAAGFLRIDRAAALRTAAALQLHHVIGARADSHDSLLS